MGIKYNYHCSNGVTAQLAAGYRVLAFWNLEELDRALLYIGGEDFTDSNKDFAYSGPYVRIAIVY